VAQAYHDFLDLLVVDVRDADAAEQLRQTGLKVHVAKTLMRTAEEKAELAAAVLAAAREEKSAAAAGPEHA
jgi:2-phospho-L-lactate transferase/gluconeogenesis factor (CofD/UPF0052 family)